jgi:hypothetical protein
MDTTTLFIPRGNDVIVTARFPEIDDGTGMNSEFWYKPNKTTLDTDSAVSMFTSAVVDDPDNAGSTMSTFSIPAEDNEATGVFWWRVDVIDVNSKRRTADCGPLLVEAV